jgi:hypothetical protein
VAAPSIPPALHILSARTVGIIQFQIFIYPVTPAGCSKRPDFSPAQPWRLFHPPALSLPRQPLHPGTRLIPCKAAASYHFLRGGWDDPNCAQSSHPPTHWHAETCHLPGRGPSNFLYLPLGEWPRLPSTARINDPSKLARFSSHGMAPVLVPLRPSSEHILIVRAPGARDQHGCHSTLFTVRVLRARRAPGRSLPILPRPRVARARGSSQLSRPFFSILLS